MIPEHLSYTLQARGILPSGIYYAGQTISLFRRVALLRGHDPVPNAVMYGKAEDDFFVVFTSKCERLPDLAGVKRLEFTRYAAAAKYLARYEVDGYSASEYDKHGKRLAGPLEARLADKLAERYGEAAPARPPSLTDTLIRFVVSRPHRRYYQRRMADGTSLYFAVTIPLNGRDEQARASAVLDSYPAGVWAPDRELLIAQADGLITLSPVEEDIVLRHPQYVDPDAHLNDELNRFAKPRSLADRLAAKFGGSRE